MGFKYGGERRKSEDVVRDSKTSGGLYDSYLQQDVTTFKSTEGENAIRILPGTWTMEDGNITKDWAYGVYLHYGIGPDQSAFLCAAKMKPGEKCVICEARKQAADEDESYALKFSWRPHAYLIDRRNEKAGPLLWGMPAKQMFNEINARSIDRHTGEVLLIDHPEEGYDVYFDREGVKNRTKYKAIDIARDPSPLSQNEDNFWVEEDSKGNVIYGGDWIDMINEHPIPDLLVFHEQEYIESILYARPVERSERRRGDDDESPRRRGGDEGRGEGRRRSREDRDEEAENIRGRRGRSDEDESPRRRSREADEDKSEAPPRRRRLATEDEDPPRRSREPDADEAPRRRSRSEEEEAPRRRTRDPEDEAPRRRSREPDEDEAPQRRGRGNGAAEEDDPPFEPRSRRTRGEETDEDAPRDPTDEAKEALEDLRSHRRSRD